MDVRMLVSGAGVVDVRMAVDDPGIAAVRVVGDHVSGRHGREAPAPRRAAAARPAGSTCRPRASSRPLPTAGVIVSLSPMMSAPTIVRVVMWPAPQRTPTIAPSMNGARASGSSPPRRGGPGPSRAASRGRSRGRSPRGRDPAASLRHLEEKARPARRWIAARNAQWASAGVEERRARDPSRSARPELGLEPVVRPIGVEEVRERDRLRDHRDGVRKHGDRVVDARPAPGRDSRSPTPNASARLPKSVMSAHTATPTTQAVRKQPSRNVTSATQPGWSTWKPKAQRPSAASSTNTRQAANHRRRPTSRASDGECRSARGTGASATSTRRRAARRRRPRAGRR